MKKILISFILLLPLLNLFPQTKNLETGLYAVIPLDSCTGMNNKIAVEFLTDTLCLNPKPLITVKDFDSCKIDSSMYSREKILFLNIKLKDYATEKFKEITTKNVGKKIAVIIDNKVVLAPIVRDPITNGRLTVGGDKEAIIKEMYEKLKREIGPQ